jgi:hypothetical protein
MWTDEEEKEEELIESVSSFSTYLLHWLVQPLFLLTFVCVGITLVLLLW